MIIFFTGRVEWSAGGKMECCEGKIFVLLLSKKKINTRGNSSPGKLWSFLLRRVKTG